MPEDTQKEDAQTTALDRPPQSKVEVAPPKQSVIALSDSGVMTPRDSTELWKYMSLLFNTGGCPKWFQNPQQLLYAHQTLSSLNVNFHTYVRFTANVQGQTVLFGDLPLALAVMSGRVQGSFDEFFVDTQGERIDLKKKGSDKDLFAAVCRVKLKGTRQVIERVFTVEAAILAGKWPGKPGSVWANYPKRMLQMKARGWLIKDVFPDILNGTAQGEYDFDMAIEGDEGKAARLLGEDGDPTTATKSVDLNALYPDEDGEETVVQL